MVFCVSLLRVRVFFFPFKKMIYYQTWRALKRHHGMKFNIMMLAVEVCAHWLKLVISIATEPGDSETLASATLLTLVL